MAEIYDGFTDRTGKPLLLELYVPVAGLEAESRAQLRTLLPVTVGGPVLLLLILLPLALSMARRIDDAGAERSALLRHAVAASALERRRIAGDLHDGVVQDLAGIGYALPAIGGLAAGRARAPPTRGATSTRSPRSSSATSPPCASVITDIYPPDLHEGGLLPASQLLVSEVRYAGVEVDLQVDPTVTETALPIDAAVLGYRVLRETLRNVTPALRRRHGPRGAAGRRRATSSSWWPTTAWASTRPAPPPEGHFGLRLLEDALEHVGGSLSIGSAPHGGHRGDAPASPSGGGAPRMIRILVADDHEILRWGLVDRVCRASPTWSWWRRSARPLPPSRRTAASCPTCCSWTCRCPAVGGGWCSSGCWRPAPRRCVVIHSASRRPAHRGEPRSLAGARAHVSKSAGPARLVDVLRSVAAPTCRSGWGGARQPTVPAARRQRAAPAVATRAPADQPPSNRYCACAR